jgi:hypothetical protein
VPALVSADHRRPVVRFVISLLLIAAAIFVLAASLWGAVSFQLTPRAIILVTGVGQLMWLVFWVQRCRSFWEPRPDSSCGETESCP